MVWFRCSSPKRNTTSVYACAHVMCVAVARVDLVCVCVRRLQAVVGRITDMCWDKCVGGDPGKDLTDKQKNCIANCSGVPSSTTGSSSVASSADLPSPPACSSLSDPEMHVHCREIPGHVNVCGESHPTEAQRRQSPLILGRRRSAWVGFAMVLSGSDCVFDPPSLLVHWTCWTSSC